MANKITVELAVDESGKGQAAIKGAKTSLDQFEGSTQKATRGGTDLVSVFKGNLLADYFQRATGAATAFAAQAVRAAAEAEDANSVLTFSATQAGIAYDTAATQAEEFGRRVGASNTEAARTFSQIIQLAERAGRGQDTDIIGKRIADLAAARGIKGAELSIVIGTLLSGADEGLNRLGLEDPGKLKANFAAEIGKTTEALNKQEIARASLVAVERLAATAEGEALKRLEGTAGQLDTARSAYLNLTTQIGEGITQSVEFRDALNLISEALGTLVTSHQEARRQLSKGLKTPEQLAQEAREGEGRQVFNAFKGGLSAQYALAFSAYDLAKFAVGGQSFDELKSNLGGNFDAVFNPGQRQYESDLERFRQTKRELDEQKEEAQANANKPPPAAIPDTAAAKKAAQEAESAYKASLQFIDDIAARSSGSANPFIKLFTEGETAAERMREKFGALGSKVVDEFTVMERKAIDVATATERIEHNLKAVELESQADALLKTQIGITAEMGRQLGLQQKQFDAATNVYKLRREAEAFERGFVSQNAFQERREDRENYDRVKKLRPEGTDEGARAGQKLIDEFIIEQTKNLPLQARFSPDAFTRQLAQDRAAALNAKASRFEAETKDEIKRAEAGRYDINLANRKLQELAKAAPGLDADVLRKEFLNITRAIDPKELSGQLREAMSVALREEAQNERQLEGEAREFRKQLVSPGGILSEIKKSLDNLKPTAAAPGVAAVSPVAAGDDGDVVRVNARAYPSRAAYEAAVFASDEERRGIEGRDQAEHG